jgi:hypothetical protein
MRRSSTNVSSTKRLARQGPARIASCPANRRVEVEDRHRKPRFNLSSTFPRAALNASAKSSSSATFASASSMDRYRHRCRPAFRLLDRRRAHPCGDAAGFLAEQAGPISGLHDRLETRLSAFVDARAALRLPVLSLPCLWQRNASPQGSLLNISSICLT